jgi:myosin VIIa
MPAQVSSLGSGLDHVMDAITECEQLSSRGRAAAAASELSPSPTYRLFYRKELFTPWYDPTLDQTATDLIFRQIVDCVRDDQYRLHCVTIYHL